MIIILRTAVGYQEGNARGAGRGWELEGSRVGGGGKMERMHPKRQQAESSKFIQTQNFHPK